MSRRTQWLLLALAATLVLVDFVGRVYVGRDAALRDYEPPAVVAIPPVAVPQTVRADLAAWMPSLAPSLAGTGQAAAATDWTLTLLGIFDERGRRTAVLHAAPATGGAPRRLALGVGDEAYGARVVEIAARAVALQTGGGTQTLRLFDAAAPSSLLLSGDGGTETRATAVGMPAPVAAQVEAGAAAGDARPAATSTPVAVQGAGTAAASQPQQLEPGEQVKLPWNLPFSNPEQAAADAAAFEAAGQAPEQTQKK